MIKLVQILAVASCACAYRVPVCMTESGARRVVPRRSMPRSAAASARPVCSPRSRADWTVTDSGLKYLDTAKGEGDPPTPGQTVNVHYTGWLKGFGDEGAKFDSSYDRRKPLSFPVGTGRVISGWDEALSSMSPGTVRKVIIPPDEGAYGKRGAGGA